MISRSFLFLLLVLFCSCSNNKVVARTTAIDSLRAQIESIIKIKKARIGLAVRSIEGDDTLYINASKPYTLMSVVKFPQALAVLHQVEEGQLAPDQILHFDKTDYSPGYSPIRDAHPEGNVNLSLKEVLMNAVSKSDNSACDKLFKLLGGPKAVEAYIHQQGIRDIGIATTYQQMKNDSVFVNWCTPRAMTALLYDFYQGNILAGKQRNVLLDLMINSSNDPRRLKGLLPEGTIVAHKTGTSNTDNGVTAAFNDAGIVQLPDGRHYAITVLISDTKEPADTNARIIASINKAVWDYFTKKTRTTAAVMTEALLTFPRHGKKPFNGVVLIDEHGHNSYNRCLGYSDMADKTPLAFNDQFVIGSISKQITAVMVLREYDKGHLQLNVPIRKYLPDLKYSWADTITIHELLTHTHGISEDEGPVLAFTPGTQFKYSQIGFALMARIIEKTSGKSFPALSAELFALCGMKRTVHPEWYRGKSLVKGYEDNDSDSTVAAEKSEIMNGYFVAAGGFISDAQDMLLWNKALHGGKLLKNTTYRMMMSAQKNAIRQHHLFGKLHYGYGITTDDKDQLLQLGQTGYLPGYASMNFYFPKTGTSVIVLSNMAGNPSDLKKAFRHHTAVLDAVRGNLK